MSVCEFLKKLIFLSLETTTLILFSLQFKIEENEFDSYAVALIHNDCLKQKVVCHVALRLLILCRILKLILTVRHQRWILVKE